MRRFVSFRSFTFTAIIAGLLAVGVAASARAGSRPRRGAGRGFPGGPGGPGGGLPLREAGSQRDPAAADPRRHARVSGSEPARSPSSCARRWTRSARPSTRCRSTKVDPVDETQALVQALTDMAIQQAHMQAKSSRC